MVLALVLALALVCLAGVICAAVVAARDAHGPLRTVWGYDTRGPLP